MAPEAEDTSNPKTNKVDIWSLGCILYRMMAGSPIFHSRREVWRHVDSASSLPSAVKSKGLSIACENFLGNVLQPSPNDRPSAEVCLTKPWIINQASGPEYSIGSDLYSRLVKIQRAAPDVDIFSDMVAYQEHGKAIVTSSGTYHSSGLGKTLGGKWLCLQDDGENLTTHRLMDRTLE